MRLKSVTCVLKKPGSMILTFTPKCIMSLLKTQREGGKKILDANLNEVKIRVWVKSFNEKSKDFKVNFRKTLVIDTSLTRTNHHSCCGQLEIHFVGCF